jgi:hypothetical protein
LALASASRGDALQIYESEARKDREEREKYSDKSVVLNLRTLAEALLPNNMDPFADVVTLTMRKSFSDSLNLPSAMLAAPRR